MMGQLIALHPLHRKRSTHGGVFHDHVFELGIVGA